LYHGQALDLFRVLGMPTPLSLQVALTSRCNLKCVFCSNPRRATHEDIEYDVLTWALETMRELGMKTVEWTGGGDPTLYDGINKLIEYAASIGLEQGLITNGVQLVEKVSQESLDILKWLRISMNCLDYVDRIDVPKIQGTLGFSYVINDKTTIDIYERLRAYADKYAAKYIRIVPNCVATDAEQELHNQVYARKIAELGPPFFYQAKTFQQPKECYWCYFKPFFGHDGYVYPCSSVVLNADAEGKFNTQYRMGTIEQFLEHYALEEAKPFPAFNCNHCVFMAQNELLLRLRNPDPMMNFV
jgi:MoaA/NifB/PqqE/SkfB family radical SAM enzyme